MEISKGIKKAVCKDCGHFLIPRSITQEELQIRERMRTGYCPKCDKDQYGVPIQVMRDDSIQKIQNKKVNYGFGCSLIWLIIFIGGFIGASPFSLDTYNTIETYFTTLIILSSFIGLFILFTIILLKKRMSIKKEIKKLDTRIDNFKSNGTELLCSNCLEPLILKKSQ